MKKLSIVFLLAFATAAFGASKEFRTQSFINGCNVIVSNNTTLTYGVSTGFYFFPSASVNLNATNAYVQSGIANTVNTNLTNPTAFKLVEGFSDANGNPASAAITIGIGSTNVFLPPFTTWPPVSTNFYPALIAAPSVSATNVVTFTFARAVMGTNFGTTSADKFVVAISATATTPIVVSTNLPTWFMQGTSAIQLLTVTADNATSSPGEWVNFVNLSGFIP